MLSMWLEELKEYVLNGGVAFVVKLVNKYGIETLYYVTPEDELYPGERIAFIIKPKKK